MTDTQLKKCPFCRSDANLEGVGYGQWTVMCRGGKCSARGSVMDTAEEAVEAWNTRPEVLLEYAATHSEDD